MSHVRQPAPKNWRRGGRFCTGFAYGNGFRFKNPAFPIISATATGDNSLRTIRTRSSYLIRETDPAAWRTVSSTSGASSSITRIFRAFLQNHQPFLNQSVSSDFHERDPLWYNSCTYVAPIPLRDECIFPIDFIALYPRSDKRIL